MPSSPLRVCSFESRRREEMARLIERSGGVPTIAPAMREVPLTDNAAVFAFAQQLLRGEIETVVFMTGVGTEALMSILAALGLQEQVLSELVSRRIAVRGPKPAAVLARWKVRIDLKAPEPNTWQDLAGEFQRSGVPLAGTTVAVQEYGQPSEDFYGWLRQQGAAVQPVPVYKWALPEDLAPLETAVRETVGGAHDVLLWTSAQQIIHVLEIADRLRLKSQWLAAANRCAVGSIGPTASERLRECGLPPDLEPSHPKMAHLVRETLERAPEILVNKRMRSPA